MTVPVAVPEIPGGRTNEPLDLGTITAKLFESKDRGDGNLLAQSTTVTHTPRFPVTRFELPVEKPAETPSVVVLDDCDEDFKEIRPHHDALRILSKTDSGVHTSLLREFNTAQTVGAVHSVAVDAARGRIYLCEQVNQRITAVDNSGRKLWHVAPIRAGALAVDPRTGNLWCCVGADLAHGETVVLDTTGREVTSFPFRGIDIAYDSRTDGFWLVGYGVTKLSREGNAIFQKPHAGWACVSVAANPRDGSVWIIEARIPMWREASTGSGISPPTGRRSRRGTSVRNLPLASPVSPRPARPGSCQSRPGSCALQRTVRTCNPFLCRLVPSPSVRRLDRYGLQPRPRSSSSTGPASPRRFLASKPSPSSPG